jgi:hypothetical protein
MYLPDTRPSPIPRRQKRAPRNSQQSLQDLHYHTYPLPSYKIQYLLNGGDIFENRQPKFELNDFNVVGGTWRHVNNSQHGIRETPECTLQKN